MSVDLESKIEVVEQLFRTAQALRTMKKRRDLAAAAAEYEGRFEQELKCLIAERDKNAQLELLAPKHEVAA